MTLYFNIDKNTYILILFSPVVPLYHSITKNYEMVIYRYCFIHSFLRIYNCKTYNTTKLKLIKNAER